MFHHPLTLRHSHIMSVIMRDCESSEGKCKSAASERQGEGKEGALQHFLENLSRPAVHDLASFPDIDVEIRIIVRQDVSVA